MRRKCNALPQARAWGGISKLQAALCSVLSVNFCVAVEHSAALPRSTRSLLRREDPLGGAGVKADPAIPPEPGVLPQLGPPAPLPAAAASVGAVVPEPTAMPEPRLAPTGTTGPPAALVGGVPAGSTLPPPIAVGVPPVAVSPPQSQLPPQTQPPASASPPRSEQQVAAEAAAEAATQQSGGVIAPSAPPPQIQAPPPEIAAASQQTVQQTPTTSEDDVRHRISKRQLRLVVFGLTLVCVLLVWEQSRMMWGIDCCCRKITATPTCDNNSEHGALIGVTRKKDDESINCNQCQRSIGSGLFFGCEAEGCTFNLCRVCYDTISRDKGCWHDFCTCRFCFDKSVGNRAQMQRPSAGEEEMGEESGADCAESKQDEGGAPSKDEKVEEAANPASSANEQRNSAGDAAGGG